MKVIQVGPDDSRPGGIRTVMLSLKNSVLGDLFGMDIIPTSSKSHRIQTFLDGSKQLKNVIKSGSCDCVHIHMSENASVYRTVYLIHWIKAHSSSRVIVQSHGGSIQSFFARCPRRIKNNLLGGLGMADLIVVLTPGWKQWWKALLPNVQYEVVPNAVDLPNITSCSYLDDLEAKKNILFMGQLGERKGTYLLIQAIPDVLLRHPDAQFVFAGDGEVDQCVAYAEELGVNDNCNFVGWADLQKKDLLLKDASMLILPSKEESFGIVLLEAMSYGLPVICSDGGFMHEVVDAGKDGLVFPSGDRAALSRAVCTLLENPGLCRKMGEFGRLKVARSYETSVAIDTWKQIYFRILA